MFYENVTQMIMDLTGDYWKVEDVKDMTLKELVAILKTYNLEFTVVHKTFYN